MEDYVTAKKTKKTGIENGTMAIDTSTLDVILADDEAINCGVPGVNLGMCSIDDK